MKIKYFVWVAVLTIAILSFGFPANAKITNVQTLIAQFQAQIASFMTQIKALQTQQQNPTTTPVNSTNALTSCNINFTDTDSPNNYLGPNIHPLKDSDWMHDADIINQVNTLIAGKTNAMDKAVAIANWVKQSRPYDFANDVGSSGGKITPANALLSVIDIYNENTGVCFDSAIITTAMLRLAGIPARVIFPASNVWGGRHAQTQAFINNQWITFDSIFGLGPAQVNIIDFPQNAVLDMGQKINNPNLYYGPPMDSGLYFNAELFKQFNIASDKFNFGALTFANIPSNSKIYPKDSFYDSTTGTTKPVFLNITRIDDKDLYFAITADKINYIFSSSQPPNIIITPSGPGQIGADIPYQKFSSNMNLLLPRMMFWSGYDNYVPGTQVNSVVDISRGYRYLATVNLPLGKYEITYYITDNQGSHVNIAKSDFTLLQGIAVKLTADKFSMAIGVNQQYYRDVIKRINSTWNTCAPVCVPSWSCTSWSDWSACTNGYQNQRCLKQIDQNNCGVPSSGQRAASRPCATPECVPSWDCTSWSDWSSCVNGYQTQTCLKQVDRNNCGIPASGQQAINRPCSFNPVCTPNWQCGSWSVCSNNKQSRTCTDLNKCGQVANTARPCTIPTCVPSIMCTSWSDWSACANGYQTQTCLNQVDQNNCGPVSGQQTVSRPCTASLNYSQNQSASIFAALSEILKQIQQMLAK